MKTSTLQVQDMLSVLSVDEVVKRIGEVPGVASVTVEFAAGRATVRYDETRLDNAEIKSAVRQRGFEPAPTHDAAAAAPASPDQVLPPKGESVKTAVSSPAEAVPSENDAKADTSEPHSHEQ